MISRKFFWFYICKNISFNLNLLKSLFGILIFLKISYILFGFVSIQILNERADKDFANISKKSVTSAPFKIFKEDPNTSGWSRKIELTGALHNSCHFQFILPNIQVERKIFGCSVKIHKQK